MKTSIDVSELLDDITRAANNTRDMSESLRCQSFIANLCGRIQRDFPEIAKALADGGGMPYLYGPKEGEV